MRIAVIGGGPAGMMAAISAAQNGASVVLFEKNEKLGKKLYISGKGRCNITNNCSEQIFLSNVVSNPKFIYGALRRFSVRDTVEFCEEAGVALKTERGNRVFPCSDKSSDVIKAFAAKLQRSGVDVKLNCEISSVQYQNKTFLLNTITDIEYVDRVIIATGGLSYSATGSSGDGFRIAKNFGHTIAPLAPALCRIVCGETGELEGLSLKNVVVGVVDNQGNILDSEFGEMLFTDDGVSGPSVLTLSSRINRITDRCASLFVDLKPALDFEKLDARILRDFSERMNKDFVNSLDGLLPARLVRFVAERSGISLYKKVNQITAQERLLLAGIVKSLRFDFHGLDDIDRGIVTAGGIEVKQINPSTMESKLVPGLYFAGEVIDVDAYTGGFNIQIALSTGYTAGLSAAVE